MHPKIIQVNISLSIGEREKVFIQSLVWINSD